MLTRRVCTWLLIFLFFGLTRFPPVLIAQTAWQSLGPDYGDLYALGRDPFNPQTIIGGVFFGGAYRSSDQGQTWMQLQGGFADRYLQTVAFDPNTSGTVYLGGYEAGIFKSADGGNTWSAQNQGLTNTNVTSIAVDPFDSNTVAAATGAGVVISRDAGQTWNPINTGNSFYFPYCVLFDPLRQGRIYVGTAAQGVIRSTDSGQTWQTFNSGMETASVYSLQLDHPSSRLYAAAFSRAFIIDPDGQNWIDITYNLSSPTVITQLVVDSVNARLFAMTNKGPYELSGNQWLGGGVPSHILSIDETGQHYILTTFRNGVFRSDDAGNTWVPSNSGLHNVFIGAMATATKSGQGITYAGSEAGVYSLVSGATQWQNPGNLLHTIFSLAVNPQDANVVFAGSDGTGLWKSTDGGTTWANSSKGIVPTDVLDIAQLPQAPYTLFAAADAAVYRSDDNGLTWSYTTEVPIVSGKTIAPDSHHPGTVYIGTQEGQVLVSQDRGTNFVTISNGLPTGPVTELKAADANGIPLLLALASDGRIWFWSNPTWLPTTVDALHAVTSFDVNPNDYTVIFAGTAGGGVYKTTTAGAVWTAQNNGLDEPFVAAMSIDPINPNTVYVSTGTGLFKSSDAGATWISAGAGLTGPVVRILCDPRNTGYVYVVSNGRVFKSTDGAQTWNAIETGMPSNAAIYSIAIDPNDSSHLYAGTALQGVYTTHDAGNTWTDSNQGMTLFAKSIAIDGRNPLNMYVGSLIGGIFKSTDGGTTFKNSGLINSVINSLAVDLDDSQTIYAGTSTGVAKSMDGGQNWVTLAQQSRFVFSIARNPSNPAILYIGTDSGRIFESTDAGSIWEDLNTGFPWHNVTGVAIDPSCSCIYAVVDGVGIYRRGGAVAPWTLVFNSASIGVAVTSLVVDPVSSIVRASLLGAGVIEITNQGYNWTFQVNGLPLDVSSLVIDPFTPGTLYATSNTWGVWKSVNSGGLWTAANGGLPTLTAYTIAADQQQSGVLYVATDKTVFKTTDGGASWLPANVGLSGADVRLLLVDQFNSSIVYAGTHTLGVFKSADGGSTWAPATTGLMSFDILALIDGPAPGVLFAGTAGVGVQKSVNGGQSWFGGTQQEGLMPPVYALRIDPLNSSKMYIATAGFGVFKSTNKGTDWQISNNGLSDLVLFSIAIDPTNSNTLYVGSHLSGVFVSDDGAQTWQQMTTNGLPIKFVTSLGVDPINHKVVYAGTEGSGVYTLTRP